MGLLALGINHTSASLAIREKAAFAPDQMQEALLDAQQTAGLREVVILSTCNRTELLGISDDNNADGGVTLQWLAGYRHIPLQELAECCYVYQGADALRHMIAVAAGLDSMVLGEPQIFGQMKSAYAVARESGTVAPELNRVFQHIFAVAKQVRTDTAIGENPISVAYAAVSLSRHIFADLGKTSALLIGAGETIELVGCHLVDAGVRRIVVANRTLGRARILAEQFGAQAVLLADIPEQLAHADIVVASTASQLPILGKGAVEQALKARKHRPIFMVDIAVPRDIEPQVAELADVYLYTIDDLRGVIEENRKSRESEARKADVIINEGVAAYLYRQRALEAVDVLKLYRSKMENLRDSELAKALRQLESGQTPEQVLGALARSLTNKLMHEPSVQLRKASAEGRDDLIAWTQELFALSMTTSDIDDSNEQP